MVVQKHTPNWSLESYVGDTKPHALSDREVSHIASLSALSFSQVAATASESDFNKIRNDLSAVVQWIDQIKQFPIAADTKPLHSPLDAYPTPKNDQPIMPVPPPPPSAAAAAVSAPPLTEPPVSPDRSDAATSGTGIKLRVRSDTVSDGAYSERLLSNAASRELTFFAVKKLTGAHQSTATEEGAD